jgi:P-type Mg2+ transporter
VAIAIALTPLGHVVGFVPLPASMLVAIAIIACLYLGSAKITKVLARRLLHRG